MVESAPGRHKSGSVTTPDSKSSQVQAIRGVDETQEKVCEIQFEIFVEKCSEEVLSSNMNLMGQGLHRGPCIVICKTYDVNFALQTMSWVPS